MCLQAWKQQFFKADSKSTTSKEALLAARALFSKYVDDSEDQDESINISESARFVVARDTNRA